jgi:hypothetical protein
VENQPKLRIYEIAHEFDLTTKEVLDACRKAGLDLKSHSSQIEDADVWMVVKAVKTVAAARPAVRSQGLGGPAAPEQERRSRMSAEHAGDLAARTVRAERFELVDSQGKVRAALDVYAGSPCLVLNDAAGKGRAMLNLLANGATLALHDAQGKLRAGLHVTDKGAGLDLFDAAGKTIWRAP